VDNDPNTDDSPPVTIGVITGTSGRGIPGQQMTNPPALNYIVENLQRQSGPATANGVNENEERLRNNFINV
jgi:hypothetical protein